MTRKHFNALALEIHKQLWYISDNDGNVPQPALELLDSVMRACHVCNSGFKYERFYKACGLDGESRYVPKIDSKQELENS